MEHSAKASSFGNERSALNFTELIEEKISGPGTKGFGTALPNYRLPTGKTAVRFLTMATIHLGWVMRQTRSVSAERTRLILNPLRREISSIQLRCWCWATVFGEERAG